MKGHVLTYHLRGIYKHRNLMWVWHYPRHFGFSRQINYLFAKRWTRNDNIRQANHYNFLLMLFTCQFTGTKFVRQSGRNLLPGLHRQSVHQHVEYFLLGLSMVNNFVSWKRQFHTHHFRVNVRSDSGNKTVANLTQLYGATRTYVQTPVVANAPGSYFSYIFICYNNWQNLVYSFLI
jgi:hypothetical protein